MTAGKTMYFKKLTERAIMPSRAHDDDVGYDLYALDGTTIMPQSGAQIYTGIAIAMPDGVWGRISPRGSTFVKKRQLVIEGTVDTGYRGELIVGVYNFNKIFHYDVRPGERLAQLIFLPVLSFDWEEVDELPESLRGENRWGSTG